jgi:hypothetical protein
MLLIILEYITTYDIFVKQISSITRLIYLKNIQLFVLENPMKIFAYTERFANHKLETSVYKKAGCR